MFNFFKKKQGNDGGQGKLPGPKDLPDDVGSYLVTKEGRNPDWVWSLKAVLKPDKEKGCFFFKIFDANKAYAKGIKIRDFNSFETHPELVLYAGWFNKNTHAVKIEAGKQAA